MSNRISLLIGGMDFNHLMECNNIAASTEEILWSDDETIIADQELIWQEGET